MEPIIYKSFTIQDDFSRNPYNKTPELMFYQTELGVDHDYDYDNESWKYCGNCTWTDSIEDAKSQIDEWEEQNADDLRLYELERKG